MKLGFIGFGEAGRAFQESLAAADLSLRFAAYDILLDREGSDGSCAAAMRARGVDVAEAGRDLAGCGWIVSAVTADQSLEAASAAAEWLGPSQVFIDINSVSPERKRGTAALVSGRGARYVDMAVMAPVHPRGHRTPVFVAGDAGAEFADDLERLGFDHEWVSAEPGDATAIKMVRSLFVKGLEAIMVEALLAASASGCFDRILASLSKSYPGLGWPQVATYNLQRTTKHGRRRAAEMRESAATLDELGLHGDLARAIAAVQDAMGGLPLGSGAELADVVEKLSVARRNRQGNP